MANRTSSRVPRLQGLFKQGSIPPTSGPLSRSAGARGGTKARYYEVSFVRGGMTLEGET
jgi:hypothetical protein